MTTADLVKNFLSSEGYRYEVDGDGDIKFKYEGSTLYFTVSSDDESFFRVIMPGVYKVDNNRGKVLEAVNAVARDLKVVKAFLVDDMLCLSVEMFIDSSPELEDFFSRCMRLLKMAREKAANVIFA